MGRKQRESTNTTKVLADRLDELVNRKKSEGLKQKDVAAALGISSGTLSSWCSDDKTASISAIPVLAKYFNVSADYLLGVSETKSIDTNIRIAQETTGLSEATIIKLQELHDWPKYLEIIDKLVISPAFEDFLSCVYHYSLLAFGEYSPAEEEIRGIVREDQARAMDYLGSKECSPLTTAFLALKSNLDNRDISKFYLNSAQEHIVNAIKRMNNNS